MMYICNFPVKKTITEVIMFANTEAIKYPLIPHENPSKNNILNPSCSMVCITPDKANSLFLPIPRVKWVTIENNEFDNVSKYNQATLSAKVDICINIGAENTNSKLPNAATNKPFVSIFPRLSLSSIEKRNTASVIHSVTIGNAKLAVVLRRSIIPYSSVVSNSV